MTNLSNQELNDNTDFAVGDVVVHPKCEELLDVKYVYDGYLRVTNGLQGITVYSNEVRHATTAEKIAKRRLPDPVTLFVSPHVDFLPPYKPHQIAILDMGEVNTLSCHVSPLCQVLNKSYMTDVIDHLVRAHKAQREVS